VSGVRPLYAHSPRPGTDQWHLLTDHLRGTGELAQRFAAPFGGGDLAYRLGLVHDVGKASCVWQDRLAAVAPTGGRVGIDHKVVGTQVAQAIGLGPFSIGVWGHHGGLIDAATLRQVVDAQRAKYADSAASAEQAITGLLPELATLPPVDLPAAWRSDRLVAEIAMRLLFGCLVDADFLDTAAHFAGTTGPRVRAEVDFAQLFERFEKCRNAVLSERRATPVDSRREQVYGDCVAAAAQRPGVFRLPAPTGAGKTLATAGFALRHAGAHGLRRVVVAVPFLTITEQNASVYRRLLDSGDDVEPVVLEHHSGVDFDAEHGGRWARLAAENWDAPFVVTTFVRLFESLFARKPAAMRRVHRLAGAVIVLDEVQALPYEMLVPILNGLRVLVDHFGSTVVLSSATQPDFWALEPFAHLDAVDLIAEPTTLAKELRRVAFSWQVDPRPTLADIAGQAAEAGSAMVVVNTTADARAVYECWRDAVGEGRYHLSTRMCPVHRRRVLIEVRLRLRNSQPVLLVSTQLIEAGVDVDFPVVFRAMAPADSLLQAAGRANRDGLLPGLGRVVVFDPADGGQPPAYRHLVGEARRFFGPDKVDPDDLAALGAYYRAVYGALNLRDEAHVGQRIQQARRRWQFQTVADGPLRDRDSSGKRDRSRAFRVIRDDGISVVTPQGAASAVECGEVEDLVERVRTARVPDLRDLRRLQPYTTNLHPSVVHAHPGVTALLSPILGTEVRAGALVEWLGGYDDDTGITIDPRVEEFVL
jgi:CRISPR-associated endonuclease/helicase Cas3